MSAASRLALGLIVLAPGLSCSRAPADATFEPDPSRAEGPLRVLGREGNLQFVLELPRPRPAAGELFEVVTTVTDARTGEAVSGARVELDAAMPEHRHGMVTRPEHEALGGGRYVTRGMKLHMPGRWELRVRAEHGALSDEAVVVLHQPPRSGT